jgi:predicted DNA-binding transcriptional regulator YafY
VRRSDRLYRLVDVLRSRSPRAVSRADLAERLEVTVRTVERDILALQQAGVPIWSQRGRGGGYAIDARWSLPPLNFDATEALAVIAALASARSMPFAEAGKRAQAKLLAAMSSQEAARARAVAGRLRLAEAAPVGTGKVLAAVEQAVLDRQVVEIDYRDRHGAESSRAVEAHGLQLSDDGAYLLGWCRLRQAGRAFRLDRISSVRPTGETAPERDIDPLVGWLDDTVAPDLGEGANSMKKAADVARRTSRPPRRVDHRTGSTVAFARAIACSLPGTQIADGRNIQTFSVASHAFLAIHPDESVVIDSADGPERSLLIPRIARDDLRARIEAAWESFASPAQRRSFNARRKKRETLAPVTREDIRRIVASLPGATEGPIWGQQIGFLVGTEKRTRFARFGPPVGSGVGNLLPPDDVDTLVILHCSHKSALLASCPERFFTTPHYGPPDEPGGVITRLAENRGAAELQELAELLEEAWQEVAQPELVAQRDRVPALGHTGRTSGLKPRQGG